jgi:hypothetical protein
MSLDAVKIAEAAAHQDLHFVQWMNEAAKNERS